ncbi:hypothetical protein MIT9_P0044 [Methylomarinovum caldicuralii]|uniref:DUF2959 domain-containing protein n=2 Tax=Methylomarinovum caldicuralii TaxID=438856 RepID=A0AAU9BQ03_9GAMM|nr:hypothetical protein MIT9_P0044 [Methylomarinovum caldicuralii]
MPYLFLFLLLTSCSSAYYGAMEKVGFHKRDILVHRIEKAREEQAETKEQFKTALEKFAALTDFHGGDLQDKYEELNAAYEASAEKAEAVRRRIADIEDVAEALFEEWKEELEQYHNAAMRSQSARQLAETKRRYRRLIAAMKRAAAKMDPVLAMFHDRVLFLKHNLNARAIASLQGELDQIQDNVASLIREMERAIAEADIFIRAIQKS